MSDDGMSSGENGTTGKTKMTGKGPRFNWDEQSDLVLFVSLFTDRKMSTAEWDAASAKLAEKGFVSSDGNPVKGTAISQHFGKLRERVAKMQGDAKVSASDGAGANPSLAPTVTMPAKRGRGRPRKDGSAAVPKTATPRKTRAKTAALRVAKSTAKVMDKDDDEGITVEDIPATKRRKISVYCEDDE